MLETTVVPYKVGFVSSVLFTIVSLSYKIKNIWLILLSTLLFYITLLQCSMQLQNGTINFEELFRKAMMSFELR